MGRTNKSTEASQIQPVEASVVFTIYCHTHVETGRRYIGLTKLTMMKRWNQHIRNSKMKRGKGCQYFWDAIRKHGPQAFSHEVLEICTDIEVANLAEQCWIEFFDTRNPEKGFNIARGGTHVPHPIKNPWDRPEFRARGLVFLAQANAVSSEERSARTSALWQDSGFHEKVVTSSKLARSTPEAKERASTLQKQVKARPEVKERQRETTRELWESESYRAQNAELWKDSDFRERCQSGLVRGASLNRAKTHCKNGHEYSVENTHMDRRGSRVCRICARINGTRNTRAARARRKTP